MTFPKLEKAIRDACPETMELTFGCRVKWSRTGDLTIDIKYIGQNDAGNPIVYIPFSQMVKVVKMKELQILGHELTLAHVLRAIKVAQDKYSISVDENGLFYTYNPDDGCWEESKGMVTFDLTKDLDGQSDETKKFLENIICQ